jgi:histidinol-phosphatase (PHP family)
LKANYHTHLKLCGHAEGMSSDYVEEAIKAGYEIIGISDHGPIKPEFMSPEDFKFNWLDRQMTYDQFINIYLPDCFNTKEKYKDKIKVLVGVEIEYIPQYHDYYVNLKDKLDYMNLAMHFYYHNGKMINSFEVVNYENVYSYALCAKEAMETGLFKILVHPDVFMYNYKSLDGKDTFDSECERAARLIIESAIKNNVYLEINVGGIFKVTSYNKVLGQFAYPRDEFWRIASEYKDLKVVIGVDAHRPTQLKAKEIKMAYKFAEKHNIILQEKVETIG